MARIVFKILLAYTMDATPNGRDRRYTLYSPLCWLSSGTVCGYIWTMCDNLEFRSEITIRRATCESIKTLMNELPAVDRPDKLEGVEYSIYIFLSTDLTWMTGRRVHAG
jgi:hypothetical protein